MFIKLYGTRGSIAVSNRATQTYGGNTTCLYVESRTGDAVVIDAGTGIRQVGEYLVKNKIKKIHLIFTHYHWDHIQGIPMFIPIFLKKSVLNIYGHKKESSVKKALSYQMTKPYWPVTMADLPSKIVYKSLKNKFKIGSLKIETIINNHPNYTLGLKFTEGKNSVAFLTDNELFAEQTHTPYKKFVNFIKKTKLLIHDAQYTDYVYKSKKGYGHSTFTQVMMLAQDAKIKNIVFTHHDPSSSDTSINAILKSMRRKYPKYNVKAAAEGMTFSFK
jgi:phosphoribosyl 1,2-cyclic phosphodiesterase